MADSKQAPLDAEAAAKAAFASVQNQPFPNDIFTAPELRWVNMAFEDKFGVTIADEDLGTLKTVGDIFNYLAARAA